VGKGSGIHSKVTKRFGESAEGQGVLYSGMLCGAGLGDGKGGVRFGDVLEVLTDSKDPGEGSGGGCRGAVSFGKVVLSP